MKYIKYTTQKLQISHDDGETWEDVSPSVTRIGNYLGTYDTVEDCESGTPQNVYSTVEITSEMENSLYGYILEDGTVRLRKIEDAEENVEYQDAMSTLSIQGIRIVDLKVEWWPEYQSREWTYDECLKKVRTIIIGNESAAVYPEIIYKFKYCNYLYLCDSIKLFGGASKNIEKIKMSKNIDKFYCSMPYVKELTFDSDVILRFYDYIYGLPNVLKKITVYGTLKKYRESESYIDSRYMEKCPNLETILVYGGEQPESIVLNPHTRLYAPDKLISLYGINQIIPMSQYKYDVSNLQTSQKAIALNIFGETVEIPSNESNILTENETKRYFSAKSETDSEIYTEGRNELSFISIGTSVEEIDSYAFTSTGGITPPRGYTTVVTLVIPNTVSSMGENVFANSSIQNLIFKGLTPPSFNNTFSNLSASYNLINNIYVPDAAYTKYFEAFIEYPWLIKKLKLLSEYEIA